MGKTLNTYLNLTASQIVAKASNTGTLTVNGSNVDCTNITITKIKNVLGTGSNNLSTLCQSSNVNIYSGFSPVEWYFTGVNYATANRRKTPYTMGSFAGYNHNAPAPAITDAVNRVAFTSTTSVLSFYADIVIGEINWSALGTSYIKFIVRETTGQTIVGSSITPINLSSGYIMNLALDINISNWTANRSLQGELYLCNAGGDIQGYIPNCSNWSIFGKYYTNGVTSSISGATGTSTILVNGNYTLNYTSSDYVDITAQIFNLYDELIAEEVIATQTTNRSFTGTFSTTLQNGYSVVFNIYQNV